MIGVSSFIIAYDIYVLFCLVAETFPSWVSLGVLGGAIVIVVMTMAMILILCRKKKEKQNPTQRDNKKPDVMVDTEKAGVDKRSQNSDRNSCISDMKLDLKDTEGSCEMVSVLKNNSLYVLSVFILILFLFDRSIVWEFHFPDR